MAVPFTYTNSTEGEKYIVYYRYLGVSVAIDKISPGETWAKDYWPNCLEYIKIFDTEEEAEAYWNRLMRNT